MSLRCRTPVPGQAKVRIRNNSHCVPETMSLYRYPYAGQQPQLAHSATIRRIAPCLGGALRARSHQRTNLAVGGGLHVANSDVSPGPRGFTGSAIASALSAGSGGGSAAMDRRSQGATGLCRSVRTRRKAFRLVPRVGLLQVRSSRSCVRQTSGSKVRCSARQATWGGPPRHLP